MVVLLIACFLFGTCLGQRVSGKIGVMADVRPENWQYLFGTGSAMNIAIDRLLAEGILTNESVPR